MTRRCSHCGHNGHNSRTCPERGVRLFGVRLTDVAMRKSASMGNLNAYDSTTQPATSDTSETAAQDGYVSDGLLQTSTNARERKKGVPWTEEEHRMFLVGLHKLGKGDWRGISRNYVQTRTPTQVASHAQKYFIRQNNLNKRKRRSSLFDIVTEGGPKSASGEELPKPTPMDTSFSPPNSYTRPFFDLTQPQTGYPAAPLPHFSIPHHHHHSGMPVPSHMGMHHPPTDGNHSPFASPPQHVSFMHMNHLCNGGATQATASEQGSDMAAARTTRAEHPIRPAPQKPIPMIPMSPATFGTPPEGRQSTLGFHAAAHRPLPPPPFTVLPWSHFTPVGSEMRSSFGVPLAHQMGFECKGFESKICRPKASVAPAPSTPPEAEGIGESAGPLPWQERLGLSPPVSPPSALSLTLLDGPSRHSAFRASSGFTSSGSNAIGVVGKG